MKYLQEIEEYFAGNLKGKDLKIFISELKNNQEFKKEFDIYKQAIGFTRAQEKKIIADSGRLTDFEFEPSHFLDIKKYGSSNKVPDEDEEFFLSLIQIEQIRRTRKLIIRSLLLRYSKVAAVILLLLGLGGTVFYNIPKVFTSDEELFNKFYSPYSHSIITRSNSEDINPNLKAALYYYDIGEYPKAISLFSNVPDSLKKNLEFFILEAVSYIEIKEYQKALQKLRIINDNSLLYTTSLWYQGLCYLKLKDNKKAKEILYILKSYEPHYKKETNNLLRYL